MLMRCVAQQLSSEEYTKEFRSYAGRERVVLRKRRTKLKVDQFRIIAQVSQSWQHMRLQSLSPFSAHRLDKEVTDQSTSQDESTLAKFVL